MIHIYSTHTYIHTYIHIRIYICVYIHTSLYLYIYIFLCVYIHTCIACVYIHTHTQAYTYTQSHRNTSIYTYTHHSQVIVFPLFCPAHEFVLHVEKNLRSRNFAGREGKKNLKKISKKFHIPTHANVSRTVGIM